MRDPLKIVKIYVIGKHTPLFMFIRKSKLNKVISMLSEGEGTIFSKHTIIAARQITYVKF